MTPVWRAALFGGVVAVLAPAAQQRPAFTARKDIVRVDALVTDAGQIVRGLSAEDFEVFDNGVRQQVDLMSSDDAPLDAILALDLSGSVAGESLRHLRTAGGAVLDALRPGEQAALITFSQSISLGVGLTKDRERVRGAPESARGSGDTALIDSSYAALVLGETDTGRALVIVFSDGLDTSNWPDGRFGPRHGEANERRRLRRVGGRAAEGELSPRSQRVDWRHVVRSGLDEGPGRAVHPGLG